VVCPLPEEDTFSARGWFFESGVVGRAAVAPRRSEFSVRYMTDLKPQEKLEGGDEGRRDVA
jgi:hypothetical protein